MPVFNKKFVSIATDDASAMTGRRAGVVALLRSNQTALLGVHCFSYLGACPKFTKRLS